MAAQAGTILRYFRADADKDISGDVFQFSTDEVTWVTGNYVPTGSLPPRAAAVHAANPPPTGLVGYWFSVLTGPTGLALVRGNARMYGKAADSPETPHFGWIFPVGWAE
jgi:hypothetical protein